MEHKEIFKDEVIRTILATGNENGILISGFGRFMLQAALDPELSSRQARDVFDRLLNVKERFGIIPRVKSLKGDVTRMSHALHFRFDTDSGEERPVWLTTIMSEVAEFSDVTSSMSSAFDAEEAANPSRFGTGHRAGGNDF